MPKLILPSWQQKGLVAWYPFTGADTIYKLHDNSPNRWHLDITWAPTHKPDVVPMVIPGKLGGVKYVGDVGTSSNDDSWSIRDGSFPHQASYTMCAWARCDGDLTSNQAVIALGSGAGDYSAIIRDGSPQDWGFYDTENSWLRSGLAGTQGDWLFAAASFDTNNGKKFLLFSPESAIYDVSTAAGSTTDHTGTGITVGQDYTNGQEFNGFIADARVYNYAMDIDTMYRLATEAYLSIESPSIVHNIPLLGATVAAGGGGGGGGSGTGNVVIMM